MDDLLYPRSGQGSMVCSVQLTLQLPRPPCSRMCMSSWEPRSLGQSTMKSWEGASAALCNSITLLGYVLTVLWWSRCMGVSLLLLGKIPSLSLQNFILYTSSDLIPSAVLNKITPVVFLFISIPIKLF